GEGSRHELPTLDPINPPLDPPAPAPRLLLLGELVEHLQVVAQQLAFLRLVVQLVAGRRRACLPRGRERLHALVRQVLPPRLPDVPGGPREAGRGTRQHQLGGEPGHVHRHRRRAGARRGVGRRAHGLQAHPRRQRPDEGPGHAARVRLGALIVRIALALGAIFVTGLAGATPPPHLVDYLYIEANEGGSSGGHVAIRFGDETYHFQHEPSGFLRLRRDDSGDFRYRYGVLGNRTTHVSRIELPDAAYDRLRWQFAERFFRERAVFAHRDALRDD